MTTGENSSISFNQENPRIFNWAELEMYFNIVWMCTTHDQNQSFASLFQVHQKPKRAQVAVGGKNPGKPFTGVTAVMDFCGSRTWSHQHCATRQDQAKNHQKSHGQKDPHFKTWISYTQFSSLLCEFSALQWRSAVKPARKVSRLRTVWRDTKYESSLENGSATRP